MKTRSRLATSLVAVLAAVSIGLWSHADAAVITYATSLAPEVSGTAGIGTAVAKYDDVALTLTLDVDWSGLTGPTTVAHIHCCVASPGTVGVAVTPGTLPGFPAGVTAGSYDATINLAVTASFTSSFINNLGGGTLAGARAALLDGLDDGTAYFNIHTTFAPGGEIRGFMQRVPEPGTLALLGLGLAGLAAARRRRQK